MKPLGLSSNSLAHALHIKPARISEVVRERRGISADTALRLARYFKTDVESWMNLQTHYDIQCAEDAAGRAIQRIAPRMDEALAA